MGYSIQVLAFRAGNACEVRGAVAPIKNIRRVKMQTRNLKDYALFAYVVLTVLGAYTALVFYAGRVSTAAAYAPTTIVSVHQHVQSK